MKRMIKNSKQKNWYHPQASDIDNLVRLSKTNEYVKLDNDTVVFQTMDLNYRGIGISYRYYTFLIKNLSLINKDEIIFTYLSDMSNQQFLGNAQNIEMIEKKEDLKTYRVPTKAILNLNINHIFLDLVYDENYKSCEKIEKTCKESFMSYLENNKSYKLIETEEEFDAYYQSQLSCDAWCQKKLVEKMLELGLGSGFISSFSELIGNDIEKYYQMIHLAEEVENKDILMYLFANLFK